MKSDYKHLYFGVRLMWKIFILLLNHTYLLNDDNTKRRFFRCYLYTIEMCVIATRLLDNNNKISTFFSLSFRSLSTLHYTNSIEIRKLTNEIIFNFCWNLFVMGRINSETVCGCALIN